MLPAIRLIGFGIRQVVGMVPEAQAKEALGRVSGSIIQAVEKHFKDHSNTLPKALARANDRAWQAVSIALAGDSFLDQIKRFFASSDDKGIREQVRLFLQDQSIVFEGTATDFRKQCLTELNQAKKAGVLTAPNFSSIEVDEVARQAASFRRYADPKGMLDEAEHVISQVADDLTSEYPNLAKLLRQCPSGGPPLLASAFSFFFRREVETDDELAHGLFFDGLRQLSASQAKAFGEVGKSLISLGNQFEQVFEQMFEQLDRIETFVVENHSVAVESHEVLLGIQAQVQHLVSQAGMQKGEVKPHQSFSIHSQDERDVIKKLLAQFRQLPAEQQQQVLLNYLGKLQFASGDFQGARNTFGEVVEKSQDSAARAEAHFNAYRAALEEKNWAVAGTEIQRAAALDAERFAPFSMQRYLLKKILGAGGFGTAFRCHDRNFAEEVVVKTLHDAAMERNMAEVFQEARLLRKLNHPAIIGVHECEYADALKHRPYIVMEFFDADSLEAYIHRCGTLSPRDVLVIAREIAEGMLVAHGQGILHRDIKPGNVLVRKAGDGWDVKIIDFGLALRKQAIETSMAAGGNTILSESVAGTVKYAPPEQMGEMKGVQPGSYSDVYSFGKLCCYALFKTTEPKSRHWTSVPRELHELLEKCTEQDLEHRLASFEPVLKVLRALDPIQKQQKAQEANRLQKEGENRLAHFLRETLDRTGGRPSPADSTAANEICKRHCIAKDRAKQIVAEVKGKWHKTHDTKATEEHTEVGPPKKPDLPTADRYADIRQDEKEYLKASEVRNGDVFLFERAPSRLARWKDGANKGLACAQFLYAQCFLQGIGVARDDVQALMWVRNAAEHGHSFAQNTLGSFFQVGRAVPQDRRKHWRGGEKPPNRETQPHRLTWALCMLRGVVSSKMTCKPWPGFAKQPSKETPPRRFSSDR